MYTGLNPASEFKFNILATGSLVLSSNELSMNPDESIETSDKLFSNNVLIEFICKSMLGFADVSSNAEE
jgi:hypothetical protein